MKNLAKILSISILLFVFIMNLTVTFNKEGSIENVKMEEAKAANYRAYPTHLINQDTGITSDGHFLCSFQTHDFAYETLTYGYYIEAVKVMDFWDDCPDGSDETLEVPN